jgi:ApeA N-terminal domain 1
MADKQLIVDSEFSIVSAFWEPQAPETVYSGTLTADEKDIIFATAPQYVAAVPSFQELADRLSGKTGQTQFTVLHGFTEHGHCTLCGCVETGRPGLNDMSQRKSITAVSYRASVAVMGMLVDGMHEKCLESARYSFTGLTDWIPKATSETWGSDHVVIVIPTEAQELVNFCMPTAGWRLASK